MNKKIYNIPSSLGFSETLAEHLLEEYQSDLPELSKVLLLLPNRRAVRSMKEAFVRLRGLTPMLLPKMMPIGEVEDEELFLTGGNARELLSGMYPALCGLLWLSPRSLGWRKCLWRRLVLWLKNWAV